MEANEQWDVSEDATYTDEQYTAVSERLLGVVFGVAAQIVEEDICSMEDVDRGEGGPSLGPWAVRNDEPNRCRRGLSHGQGLRSNRR